jgi:putative membrane protein
MSELNVPRVFFAAERIAGVEPHLPDTDGLRFRHRTVGLFLQLLSPKPGLPVEKGISFWVGIAFVLLGAYSAASVTLRCCKVLRKFKPIKIPGGYSTSRGMIGNLLIALPGLTLVSYLFLAQ